MTTPGSQRLPEERSARRDRRYCCESIQYHTIRCFLSLLRKSEAGRIVNVPSTLEFLTDQSDCRSAFYGVTTLAYKSSKTALNAITVQAAKELAPGLPYVSFALVQEQRSKR
jgi:hypothetical protein